MVILLHAMHHAVIRDEECCYLSSSLAVGLAKNMVQIYMFCIYLLQEKWIYLNLALLKTKILLLRGCVHHLTFSAKDYEELGNFIVCNPSIKTEEDRLGLIEAVKADKIDIFATDHAPHTLEEKNQKYTDAPAGIPLVQHSLQMFLEFYFDNIFSIETIVEKSSHNVANDLRSKTEVLYAKDILRI